MGDIVSGRGNLMTIELQFISIIVQASEIEETYPLMFSAIQQFLPVRNTPKRRLRKRETVGHLIDEIIDSIESSFG